MDSYRSLIENGKYSIVLSLTANSVDNEALYYRMMALALSEQYEESIAIIKQYREAFLENIPNCRKELFVIHMRCLKMTDNLGQLLMELDYYDALPYLDYEFEELIKETKASVFEGASLKKGNEGSAENLENIRNILKHPDEYDNITVISSIEELRNYEIDSLITEIKEFLKSDYDDLTRTYMLLLLVAKGSYEEFEFSKNGIEYTIVPYELDPPFENEFDVRVFKLMAEHAPSPTILKFSKDIYSRYVLMRYPETFEEIAPIDIVIATYETVAYMLNEYLDTEELVNEFGGNRKVIDAFREDIVNWTKKI